MGGSRHSHFMLEAIRWRDQWKKLQWNYLKTTASVTTFGKSVTRKFQACFPMEYQYDLRAISTIYAACRVSISGCLFDFGLQAAFGFRFSDSAAHFP
jgi:hypothetical protein